MSDKAVISGTYSDFKIIRSRKVAQLVVEVPIEQAQALITALGLPNPAEETWVAVARLQGNATPERLPPPITSPLQPHRRFEDLPMSQQAALACQDMEFREYLRRENRGISDEKDAAEYVRAFCGVNSRADIRPGTKAEKMWLLLYSRYQLWLSKAA